MPSSNHKTQPQRREPLRWLALGVILLAFVAICCTSQIVTYVLTPRNLASQLLLLSPNSADYSPWRDGLLLPPLAPEVPEAMAAERSTAELALTVTPTPVLVGAVPTGIVAIVPPPPDAPQPTPAGVRIVLVPTPTPTTEQPAAGGANTPVPTAPSQPNNPIPSDTPVPAIPTTDTEDRPQPTPTNPDTPPTNPPDSGGGTTPAPTEQSPTQGPRPTPRPRTPQPTTGATAQPPTQEPVRPTPRPRPPRPTATFTPAPATPTATFTPRPVQPTATFTPRPVQPTATFTPEPPPPTATFTPEPPPPTATFTPEPPPPTPTFTPEPPPPTPTETPIPVEDPEVSKSMSPSNPGLLEPVTYTIEIANNTGTAVTINSVVDVIVLDDPPAEPFSLIDCRGILSGSEVGGCGEGLAGSIVWNGNVTLADGEIFIVEIEGTFQSIGETYTFCNNNYSTDISIEDEDRSVSGSNEVCVTFDE